MNRKGVAVVSGVALILACAGAWAATKSIECKLPMPERGNGSMQMMFVTLDDDSDKAEVVIKVPETDCSKPNECSPVFQKTVLPSVIRLTRSTHLSMLDVSSSHTIDIDRTTLAVTSHIVVTGKMETDATLTGTCEVKKVDTAKKVL